MKIDNATQIAKLCIGVTFIGNTVYITYVLADLFFGVSQRQLKYMEIWDFLSIGFICLLFLCIPLFLWDILKRVNTQNKYPLATKLFPYLVIASFTVYICILVVVYMISASFSGAR